ncbi:MAG: sugar kinase [Bacillota bacterium]
MVDIISIGEAMAVFVPAERGPLRHVRRFEKHVAGAEFNLAIGASRLGLEAGWISRVGQDEFGEEIVRVLRSEGVDTRHVHRSSQPTGVYFKEYSALGEPRVLYYRAGSAASEMGPDDVDPGYIASAQILHVTGITPLLSDSCLQATRKAIDAAHQAGVTVVLDPNIRYKLVAPGDVPAVFRPLLQDSDLVLAGENELRAILLDDASPLERLEEAVLDLGPRLVVVKRGASGAVARTAAQRVEEGPFAVQRVVDPIGAGDGFDAGFLAGWLRRWDLRRCLRLGNLVGACATGVHGDYEGYPAWEEALATLERHQSASR